VGPDAQPMAANRAAQDLLEGPSAAMVLGRVRAVVDQVLATGLQRQDEVEIYGPPPRTVRLRAVALAGGVLVEVDDVSEARRLEGMRRDFVANVSHELKTPVGALALLAETLAGERDPTVAGRLVERIREESARLAVMVGDLLDLSRLEAEKEHPRDPVVLDEVVMEAAARARSAAEHKGVALELGEPAGARVLGAPDQLVSAVFNLLENAIVYSDAGSVVRVGVSTGDPGGGPEVWVEDHGIGIPPKDLERIFERFYRVDRARSRATGGTGLGLAIVRHVAHNHGAEIAVTSRLGAGSRFCMTFPASAQVTGQ
jgi:two-component system, OmpR family, sensor histidine kinase SenX3